VRAIVLVQYLNPEVRPRPWAMAHFISCNIKPQPNGYG